MQHTATLSLVSDVFYTYDYHVFLESPAAFLNWTVEFGDGRQSEKPHNEPDCGRSASRNGWREHTNAVGRSTSRRSGFRGGSTLRSRHPT